MKNSQGEVLVAMLINVDMASRIMAKTVGITEKEN